MIKKKRTKGFYVGIAAAILLPLSFYLLAKGLKKDKIIMPSYYVPEKIDTIKEDGQVRYDTVFHRLNDLKLTNQLGQTVSLNEDLKGKILVINFFFASCPVVCPKLTQNMAALQHAFRRDRVKKRSLTDSIQLISITVNPERDSFPVLRQYADRYQVDHDRWWFLTGDKRDIYNFARNELRVVVGPGDGGSEDFIHTEKIVVVDKDRYIRGYYDGLDSASVGAAAYEISLLNMEKKRNRKKQ